VHRAGDPEPVQPTRDPDFDHRAYRDRNWVERLVGKLKQFRRVATRYDKLDPHSLAFVQLASIMVWLRTFGDTA
jgi:transposase